MDFKLPWQKIMRITILAYIILTSASSFLQATPVNAQALDKRISVNYKNTNAFTVITELQQKTNTDFGFTKDLNLDKIYVEKLQLKNEEIRGILKNLLKGQQIGFKEKAGAVILFKIQQPGRISGKVVDDKGESMPGASVKIIETGQTLQTSVDGTYNISLKPGTYTLEVSYISFQKKRISDVVVTSGGLTHLDVLLKPSAGALKEVVVTSSYKKESVAGLYVQQKNAASVTDGISSEQIGRTPDNNMGQVLKRISGVTTVDNKYVVVRGLSERYNQAMIDGVVLPSTSMNKRNFSFDVLPQELVSSVVVNKTATPDMSAEFSGGQVSVNTLDIPTENFTSITIGAGYNSQSTGKDFLMLGGRGKYDYLGFDDKRRKEPAGIIPWFFQNGIETPPPGPPGNDYPLTPGQSTPYNSLDAVAQSKKLNSEAFKMARYKTAPNQNLRFALGRIYDLKDGLKFGFSGGASYRNQQSIVDFNNVRGNPTVNWMDSTENGAGKSYRFNTTLGAVLNFGVQGKTFKVALKNMYSRIFDDNFNEAYRLAYGQEEDTKFREQFEEPQTTQVWQHKLEGENLLCKSGIKLDYSFGQNRIGQEVQDQRRLKYFKTASIGGVDYFQTPNVYFIGRNGDNYDYRLWTQVKETDYNWKMGLSRDFDLGRQVKNTAKIGYAGWHKHRTLSVTRMIPFTFRNTIFEQPYEVILDPEIIGAGPGKAYYWAEGLNGPAFDGTMKSQAVYAMLDQRFFQKLRLVYGFRAENYNLSNRQEEYIKRRFGEIPDAFKLLSTTGEKNWRILPSANLTYSLTEQMNFRAAYSKTAIRPDFRETAYFGFYDYELDANISGMQLTSTIIDNMDLRYEWYPRAGEVISISGFYKKMDKPIELVYIDRQQYRFQNQHSAKNYGLEMEIRKSLDFISDQQWLKNLTVFGNGTIIRSKVEVQLEPLPGENVPSRRLPAQDRPLYGQSPWIVNAGITYQNEIIGFTASYNKSGSRTYSINEHPAFVEYEKGRNLIDVQVSAKVWRKRGEFKLNLSNLFNEYTLFYANANAYESIQSEDGVKTIGWKLVNGTTNYEKDKGDVVTYRSKAGRTANLSFAYKF